MANQGLLDTGSSFSHLDQWPGYYTCGVRNVVFLFYALLAIDTLELH